MWRNLVWVAARLVLAAAGLALAATSGAAASDAYSDMRGYERAPQCASRAPGDQRDCIATVTVTVVKRSTRVENDSPDTPIHTPPAPPMPPPMPPPVYRFIPVAAGAQAVADALPAVAVRAAAAAGRLVYEVTVRTPDGKRRTYDVTKALYDKAKPGTTGRAEMWRGHVTRLTVGSESKRISLFRGFFFYWLVAWAGAVLFLTALFYPIGEESGQILIGGYVVGAAVLYLLRDWPPAVLGVPAVVAVLIAVLWAMVKYDERKARSAWLR